MNVLFLKWQHDIHTSRQTLYYDVTLGRLMYINGSGCREMREPIFSDIDLIPLGFASMGGCTEGIQSKLRLANSTLIHPPST